MRQLEEALLLDLAHGRIVLKIWEKILKVNRNVLKSIFDHWML